MAKGAGLGCGCFGSPIFLGRSRSRFLGAHIAHPIEPALCATPSRGKVEGTIVPEFHIRDVERLPGKEIFECASVAGALGLEMDRNDPAIGPIHRQQGLFIFFGEIRFCAELHARRRADSDVDDRRQSIVVPLGPLRRAFAKTVVTAAHEMIDANRAVPWHTPIPFHVAVEAENLSFGAEIKIVGVAHSCGHQLNILCIGIQSEQETARRLFARAKSIAIFGPRKHLIVGIIPVRRGR